MKLDIRHTLKSKTIRGILIVLIAVLMQIFAIQPEQVSQTIDEFGPTIDKLQEQPSANNMEFMLRLAEFFGLAYAAYGRVVAQQPLVKKKGEGTNGK